VAEKKIKPDEVDIEITRLLGRGYTSLDAGIEIGLGRHALRNRMHRLRVLTGTVSQANLVYWMLTEGHIWYWSRWERNKHRPSDAQLQVVELIAAGLSEETIRRQLHLSTGGFGRRVRDARIKTSTKSQAHLVAICWAQNWIA
jgi:DNA-binding CsgD family transcriptional regulator